MATKSVTEKMPLDAQRFVDTVRNCFFCPICTEIAVDMVEHIDCNTIFCRNCIDLHRQSVMSNGSRVNCPQCIGEMPESSVRIANRHLRDEFNNLKIHCCNYPACTETPTVERFEIHENKCDFGECSCAKCNKLLIRHELDDHEKNFCPRRLINCIHCNAAIAFEDQPRHKKKCLDFPRICKYCKEPCTKRDRKSHRAICKSPPFRCDKCNRIMGRQNIENHNAICPKMLLPCGYENCEWTVHRCKLNYHQYMCGYQFRQCHYCMAYHQSYKLRQHFLYCDSYPLKCEACGQNDIERIVFREHESICPEIVINCPVEICGFMCARKDIHQHYKEFAREHIEYLLWEISSQQTMMNTMKTFIEKQVLL